MTSKYFVQGNASDDDEQANEDSGERIKQPAYTYGFLDDDRPNNEKHKVLTEKQKRWTIIRNLCNQITSGLNSKDFEKVWQQLQELLKEVQKSQKVIEKEGYPGFFLKLLHRINEEIEVVSTGDKQRMKKHSSTSFNIMRQKMKKIYPQFQELIKQFLDKAEEEEEEPSESEQQESEESEEEEEEDQKKLLESKDPMERRKYWLKKIKHKEERETDEQKDKQEKDKQEKQKKKPKEDKFKSYVAQLQKKKKLTLIESGTDVESQIKKIMETFTRLTDQQQRLEYIDNLKEINRLSSNYKEHQKLSLLIVDIPIRLELARQMKSNFFMREHWLSMFQNILEIITLLKESEDEELLNKVIRFDGSADRPEKRKVTRHEILISVKAFLIILDNELKKVFLFLDSAEIEYAERLQDLLKITDVLYQFAKDLNFEDGMENEAVELAFKVLENVYFMNSDFLKKIEASSPTKLQFVQLSEETKMQKYAQEILSATQDEDISIKTLLYLVYNQALNHREAAKDLLIISSIPEMISSCDYYTQAIYNRVIVQIGLNAFHHGNMFEVQQYLSELCSYGKNKDQTKEVIRQFLAQGYSRFMAEKEIPRNKIMAYYLHLNVDTIESLQLIASMLLEIPYTLTEGGRITSKTFKKVFYEYERSHFIAEPLNNRDLIYAACSELKEGKWKQCYERLMELSIWDTLSDVDVTKCNLLKIIKEQSLKCYLIGNRKCFSSVSLSGLASKFEIDLKATRRLICKMIYERQIQGSLTHEGYLNFVQKKQSEMQKICEQVSSKLNDMMTANEQLFNLRVHAHNEDQEELEKDEAKFQRKDIAFNEKLKSILSKRNEKHV